jgi:hypothetical protein
MECRPGGPGGEEIAMATDWAEKLKEAVQPHVPAPVEAVGMLQPAGTWGSFGVGYVSPLAGMFMRSKANKRAGGLAKDTFTGTKMAMLAVTADRVYAFKAKPSGRNWKVQEQVGEWARNDLRVTATPGKLTTKVAIDVVSSGDHFELEATTVGNASKEFQQPFLDAMTGRS